MNVGLIILIVFLFLAMYLSVKGGKLTVPAALVGGVLALFIYAGAGLTGIILLTAFFILGTAATSWKMEVKERAVIAERDKGRRKASQVLANVGVPALLGAFVLILPQHSSLFQMMMAAAFSSATADTLSSELGNVYGKKFYNILTLKKDARGLNGVVSAEGTLIGVVGSSIMAVIYAMGFGWDGSFISIIIAGTIGNFTDSFLGATLERKGILKNDGVNFLNTLIAALAGAAFYFLF